MWCAHLSTAATLPAPVFLPIKLPRHKYLGTGAQLLLRFNEKTKKKTRQNDAAVSDTWWSSRTLKQNCLFPFFPFSGPKFTKQLNWHHNALTEEPPTNQPQLNNWSACWAVVWCRADMAVSYCARELNNLNVSHMSQIYQFRLRMYYVQALFL